MRMAIPDNLTYWRWKRSEAFDVLSVLGLRPVPSNPEWDIAFREWQHADENYRHALSKMGPRPARVRRRLECVDQILRDDEARMIKPTMTIEEIRHG